MNESVVLFIGNLTIGGAERVTVNLAEGLSDEGYDVEIALLKREGRLLEEVPERVSIFELSVDRLRWSLIPLAKYLRRAQPDVLISFMTAPNVMALFANQLTQSPALTIATEHNTQTMFQSKAKRFEMKLAKFAYRYADYVVGVSEGVAADVAEWASLPTERIRTIYNPVIDSDIIGREWERPSHPWFEQDDIPIVMSAGRHVEQKDYPTLIRAFAQLTSDRDARLVILGEGPLTADYEQLARSLGVSGELVMPGFVDSPYRYMYHSDVFALSSSWEGLSMVLVEAMACGTPVVSTDCPNGPSEVLADGKYGPLVPIGDSDRLYSTISDLISKPTARETLLSRSNEFSIENATYEYINLFMNDEYDNGKLSD